MAIRGDKRGERAYISNRGALKYGRAYEYSSYRNIVDVFIRDDPAVKAGKDVDREIVKEYSRLRDIVRKRVMRANAAGKLDEGTALYQFRPVKMENGKYDYSVNLPMVEQLRGKNGQISKSRLAKVMRDMAVMIDYQKTGSLQDIKYKQQESWQKYKDTMAAYMGVDPWELPDDMMNSMSKLFDILESLSLESIRYDITSEIAESPMNIPKKDSPGFKGWALETINSSVEKLKSAGHNIDTAKLDALLGEMK